MPLYINTWWEGAERTEPLSAVPRARTRGNEHKLNTRGTSVLCGRQSTDSGCSERLWGLLGDLICSCMDGYPALGVPAGAWVGPDGPRSLSEPQPHSDSEILCNSITPLFMNIITWGTRKPPWTFLKGPALLCLDEKALWETQQGGMAAGFMSALYKHFHSGK